MKKCLISLFPLLFLGLTALQAQVPLSQYQFSSGVSTSKWMSLSSAATTLIPPDAGVNKASTVQSIGFSFPFGTQSYTQFSVNTNGALRFGPSRISSQPRYGLPFDSNNLTIDLPKIDLVGDRCGSGVDGYIKSELKGSAPNRTLVVEYRLGEEYSYDVYPNTLHWQVQLSENGNITIVYGPEFPDNYPFGFQAGMASDTSDVLTIYFDSVHVAYGISVDAQYQWPNPNSFFSFTYPSCMAPSPIAIDSITQTSAHFSWTTDDSSLTWKYLCLPKGQTPNWDNAPIVRTPSVSINNLQMGHSYQFLIRTICSSTILSNPTVIPFTTNCHPYTIPYTENFDSYTEDIALTADAPANYPNHFLPICWTYPAPSLDESHGPSVWLSLSKEFDNYTQVHSIDSVSLHLFTSTRSSDSTYVALPLFNEPLHRLKITFDYILSDTFDCVRLGIMTQPHDFSTFVSLDTLPSNTLSGHYQYLFTTATVDSAQSYYIAIAAKGFLHTPTHISIDNIVVDYNSTCFSPNQIVVDNLTTTTAQVSWNSPASSFELAYAIDTNWSYLSIDTTSTILTQLTPASHYQLKVRALCSDTETSPWSEIIHFNTPQCQPVSQITVAQITPHSAQISWHPNGQESSWNISYGPQGIEPIQGTLLTSSDTLYTLASLTPNTSYDVFVRAQCFNNEFSSWSTPAVTFTTLPNPNDPTDPDEPEGIDPIQDHSLLSLYPNPTTGLTTLHIGQLHGKALLRIINPNGHIVMQQPIEGENHVFQPLNLTHLPQGTYFVQLIGDNINSVRKLIIK